MGVRSLTRSKSSLSLGTASRWTPAALTGNGFLAGQSDLFGVAGWVVLEAVQRFASGLRDDYAAVTAGMTLPWSTSPVEGHINRLKMVKRQMFGRAHLDLLSRRFLLAPRDTGRDEPPAEYPIFRGL